MRIRQPIRIKKTLRLKISKSLVDSSCLVILVIYTISINTNYLLGIQLRPYTLESTGSRPISEVKLVMARVVVLWVTKCEVRVP